MGGTSVESSQITHHLRRFAAGESGAIDDLIESVSLRLETLTRRMLSRFAGVRRWERTDDVLQNATLRLLRSLDDVKPANGVEFLSLAALQIRRELLDLARHYFGPQGQGANHTSWPSGNSDAATVILSDGSADPMQLAEWREVQQYVVELPVDQRTVILLLYYHGLSQADAAKLLGVSVRTVQRRWQASLLALHRILKDGPSNDA